MLQTLTRRTKRFRRGGRLAHFRNNRHILRSSIINYDIVRIYTLMDNAPPASSSKFFYDSFSSTIDRSERLTPVQKFHYLRSSLTGNAARSIQPLHITDLNYSIAIDVLKEKFDCHRQVCMRHWDLIFDYPKITKETPEVKVNLQAFEKLSEPVT